MPDAPTIDPPPTWDALSATPEFQALAPEKQKQALVGYTEHVRSYLGSQGVPADAIDKHTNDFVAAKSDEIGHSAPPTDRAPDGTRIEPTPETPAGAPQIEQPTEEIKETPSVAGALARGDLQTAFGLAKAHPSEPTIKLPRVPEQGASLVPGTSIPAAIPAAVINAAAQTAEGLSSPVNLATLPLTAVKGLGRVAAGVFGTEMAAGIPQQIAEAEKQPTVQGRLEGGLGALASLFLGAGALKHGVLPDHARAAIASAPDEAIQAAVSSPEIAKEAPALHEAVTQEAEKRGVAPAAAAPQPENPDLKAAAQMREAGLPMAADALEQKAKEEAAAPKEEVSPISETSAATEEAPAAPPEDAETPAQPESESRISAEPISPETPVKDSAHETPAAPAAESSISEAGSIKPVEQMSPEEFYSIEENQPRNSSTEYRRRDAIVDALHSGRITEREARRSAGEDAADSVLRNARTADRDPAYQRQKAIDEGKPFSVAAVEQNNIPLPEGYVREGDFYVYKGEDEGEGEGESGQAKVESGKAKVENEQPKAAELVKQNADAITSEPKTAAEDFTKRSEAIRSTLGAAINERDTPAVWIDHQLVTPKGKYEPDPSVKGGFRKVQDLSQAGFERNLDYLHTNGELAQGENQHWGANQAAKDLIEKRQAERAARSDAAEKAAAEKRAVEDAARQRENAFHSEVEAKVSSLKFKRGEFSRSGTDKDGNVIQLPAEKAQSANGLAITKNPSKYESRPYTISHIESGKRVGAFENIQQAKAFVARASELVDFTKPEAQILKAAKDHKAEIEALQKNPYSVPEGYHPTELLSEQPTESEVSNNGSQESKQPETKVGETRVGNDQEVTPKSGVQAPEVGDKVRVSGAVYDFVKRNDDGTITVKSDSGEFDTAPGEKWERVNSEALRPAHSGVIDTAKISREQFIKNELDTADRQQSLKRLEAEQAIRREFEPSKPLPVGVSKITALLTKVNPTKAERALIRAYEASAPLTDRRLASERAGRLWDAFAEKQKNGTTESKNGLGQSDQRPTTRAGDADGQLEQPKREQGNQPAGRSTSADAGGSTGGTARGLSTPEDRAKASQSQFDRLRDYAQKRGATDPEAAANDAIASIAQTKTKVLDQEHLNALLTRKTAQVVTDQIREAKAGKRGGEAEKVSLDQPAGERTGSVADVTPSDTLAPDKAEMRREAQAKHDEVAKDVKETTDRAFTDFAKEHPQDGATPEQVERAARIVLDEHLGAKGFGSRQGVSKGSVVDELTQDPEFQSAVRSDVMGRVAEDIRGRHEPDEVREAIKNLFPGGAHEAEFLKQHVVAGADTFRDLRGELGRDPTRDEWQAAMEKQYPEAEGDKAFFDPVWQHAKPVADAYDAAEGKKPVSVIADEALGIRRPATGESKTGLANANVDEARTARGEPPLMKAVRQSNPETWDKAMGRMDSDPTWQSSLIDELKKKPRAIDAEEGAAVLQRLVSLREDYRNAVEALNEARESDENVPEREAAFARISDDLRDVEDITKETGTIQAQSFQFRQALAKEDYSLAKIVREREADKGRPLTPEEHKEVERIAKGLEEARQRVEKLEQEAEQRRSDAHLDDAVKQMQEHAAGENPKVASLAERVVQALEAEADKARARIRSRLANASAGVDPTVLYDVSVIGASHIARGSLEFSRWSAEMIKDLGEKVKPFLADAWKMANKQLDERVSKVAGPERAEAVRSRVRKEATPESVAEKIKAAAADGKSPREMQAQIQKLALEFVKSGVKGRDAVVDAVHKITEPLGMSRRETADAISGYGDFKPLDNDPAKTELRGIKGELQQISKLEDMAAGKAPLKTGIERREPTDEERRLTKQVNEAKKAGGFESNERTLKTALDAVKTRLSNQIKDLQAQIDSGSRIVKAKNAVPTDAEADALREKRDELKKQFDSIFGPDIADAQRLANAKRFLERRSAELQEGLANKDFSPKPKPVPVKADPELLTARAQFERLKEKYEGERLRDQQARRSTPQKITDFFAHWAVSSKLMYVQTLGKLVAALVHRGVSVPMEEAVGSVLNKLPGVNYIASRAPLEGGPSVRALAKYYTGLTMDGMKDAFDKMTTGKTDLEAIHEKRAKLPPSWYDVFGTLHGAIKSPLVRAKYELAMDKQNAWAIKNGVDPSDPLIQMRFGTKAYEYAVRDRFGQKNLVVDMVNRMVQAAEQARDKETGQQTLGGKIAKVAVKQTLPIVRVPTNYVAESLVHAFGTLSGSAKLVESLSRGKPITEDVANQIMRHWKKGALGGALLAYGYYGAKNGAIQAGGYYQPGERRKEGAVQFGGIRINYPGGHYDVPSFLVHSPLLEPLQLGATVYNALHRHSKPDSALDAAGRGVLGLLEESPVLAQRKDALHIGPTQWIGDSVRGNIPGFVQELAQVLDRDYSGHVIKRSPKGFVQSIEVGLPGLRRLVPKAKAR